MVPKLFLAKFLEILTTGLLEIGTSAKEIGLNFWSNCACAALNLVPWSVARGFLRLVSFENKQCVNQLIHIELFVLLFKSRAGFYTTLLTARKPCTATLTRNSLVK